MSKVDFKNFDWSQLNIPKLEESQNNKSYRSCKPTLKNGKSVQFQIPFSLFPFGASPPNPEKKILKWSLPIARDELPGITKPLSKEFFATMENFDKFLINYASKNAQLFFNVPTKGIESCTDFLNPCIKHDKNAEKDEKYGPRIQPELMFNKETNQFEKVQATNVKSEKISITDILPKSKGYAIIELTTFYSVNYKNYGALWIVRNVDIIENLESEAAPIDRSQYGDCPALPHIDDVYDPKMEEALREAEKRERPEDPPVIERDEEHSGVPAENPKPAKKSKTKK